jgi:hypothetical protein
MISRKSSHGMKTKVIAAATLLLMITISGCGGSSPREIGKYILISSIGMVILSIPIIMLMTWLAKLGLGRSRIVWAQFVGLTVISIGLCFYDGGDFSSDDLNVIAIIGVISIPYLLLVTSLAVIFIPKRVCKYLPILVITPHFAASCLLILTDSEGLLGIFPLMLPIRLWPLTIAILICSIGYLILKKLDRIQEDDSDKRTP